MLNFRKNFSTAVAMLACGHGLASASDLTSSIDGGASAHVNRVTVSCSPKYNSNVGVELLNLCDFDNPPERTLSLPAFVEHVSLTNSMSVFCDVNKNPGNVVICITTSTYTRKNLKALPGLDKFLSDENEALKSVIFLFRSYTNKELSNYHIRVCTEKDILDQSLFAILGEARSSISGKIEGIYEGMGKAQHWLYQIKIKHIV